VSTVDAAALCKMAERGQITARSSMARSRSIPPSAPEAAAIKGVKSAVAGAADILLVPDLESGNMLAKQLEYLGGAKAGGIVLGASVPIILTSPRRFGEKPVGLLRGCNSVCPRASKR